MAAKLTKLTHKIAIQLHLVAESSYNLQFWLQAASPETFGYTLVCFKLALVAINEDPSSIGQLQEEHCMTMSI
jgi:hypothetical protein